MRDAFFERQRCRRVARGRVNVRTKPAVLPPMLRMAGRRPGPRSEFARRARAHGAGGGGLRLAVSNVWLASGGLRTGMAAARLLDQQIDSPTGNGSISYGLLSGLSSMDSQACLRTALMLQLSYLWLFYAFFLQTYDGGRLHSTCEQREHARHAAPQTGLLWRKITC